MKVHFTLRKDIATEDELGAGYVYTMTEHPTSMDLMVVHFQTNHGEWDSVTYTKEEVETKFREKIWSVSILRTAKEDTLTDEDAEIIRRNTILLTSLGEEEFTPKYKMDSEGNLRRVEDTP